MIHKLGRIWNECKVFFRVLPIMLRDYRNHVCFYSEGAHEWPHFAHLLEELVVGKGCKVLYLSSSKHDADRFSDHPQIQGCYIGSDFTRMMFFRLLQTKVMVLSLPDLDQYSLRRSIHPVHYVYLFHAMNSVHSIYQNRAFHAYDSFFCVGPHHVAELRRYEQVHQLGQRTLIPYGYGRLDRILSETARLMEVAKTDSIAQDSKVILVAPTWGKSSFIEDERGLDFVTQLLKTPFSIVLRLHPETKRHHPRLVERLRAMRHERFLLDEELDGSSWLRRADLMISDWSSAAFEFAFSRLKPVVFVDSPSKILNTRFEEFGMTPIEVGLRQTIGRTIAMDRADTVSEVVADVLGKSETYENVILAERTRVVYHLGASHKVGADYIESLVNEEVVAQKSLAEIMES